MQKVTSRLLFYFIICIAVLCIGAAMFFFFANLRKSKIIKENENIIDQTIKINKNLKMENEEIKILLSQKDESLRKDYDLSKISLSKKNELLLRYKEEIIRQDDIIKKYQNMDIQKDKLINDLKKQLEKSTKVLSKNPIAWGFRLAVLPGVQNLNNFQDANFCMIINLDYIRYFFNGHFGIGGGGWIQPVNNFDAGISLALNINF